jgi:predicted Zn-dependent protease
MLKPHVTHNPRNQVLALNQANALISAQKYDDAIILLKDFLLVKKDYQVAYQMMSEAYQKAKRFSQMHQSKAEVYALYGAYNRAVDELQYAYNFAGDNHLQKQRIRARIKQFRDQEDRLERL